mgnify:CR=1 FL=1
MLYRPPESGILASSLNSTIPPYESSPASLDQTNQWDHPTRQITSAPYEGLCKNWPHNYKQPGAPWPRPH